MYPKDKYEWYVLLAALLCILLGISMSLAFLDWQWLERSGSPVVIVALCFFWKDRVDRDEEFIQRMIDVQKECEETLEPIRSPDDYKNKEIVIYFNVDERKAKERIQAQRKRYTNIEIGVGVFGTLVWGYGSPFGDLLFSN